MEEQTSIKSVSIKYGLILGIIGIVTFLIGAMTGDPSNSIYTWIGILITIVGIIMAHREYKNEGDGFMTYGQGLGIGTLVSLVSSIISGVFLYVYIKFIDANYMSNVQMQQIEEMEKRGMSDEEIEMGLSITEKMSSPELMFVFAIIGGVFFGFIISLIVSAFTKNSNPELSV